MAAPHTADDRELSSAPTTERGSPAAAVDLQIYGKMSYLRVIIQSSCYTLLRNTRAKTMEKEMQSTLVKGTAAGSAAPKLQPTVSREGTCNCYALSLSPLRRPPLSLPHWRLEPLDVAIHVQHPVGHVHCVCWPTCRT